MVRWIKAIGLLLALVLCLYFVAHASVPPDVLTIGTVTSCTAPEVELEFTAVSRCSGGPRAGRRCEKPQDCPQGQCVATPQAPSTLRVEVVDPDNGNAPIGGPVVLAPAAFVRFGLPAPWFRSVTPGARRRLVVRWTSTCQGTNTACASDADCAGNVCLSGTEQFDVRIVAAPGTC